MTAQRTSLPTRYRWWGLAGGIATAIFDTATMVALGVAFEINGRDVTPLVGAYFGLSFAVLGFLAGYALDARRRDQATAAVMQAQAEAINQARVQLAHSEKLAALGQLATAIAHEVRNPLAVIRSAAQSVGESVPAGDGDVQRSCTFITAEIDRLTSVIGSLLAFARPPHVQARSVPVRDLFDRALQLAGKDLQGRDVRVARREAPGTPPVHADPDLLCQLLLGLMDNAAEAAGRGAEVDLEARAVDNRVELAVSDTGPGVPAELRSRIFEPFFTTRANGTGLGLAVARQIAEAHGGQISVGERPGGGARFSVVLPAAA